MAKDVDMETRNKLSTEKQLTVSVNRHGPFTAITRTNKERSLTNRTHWVIIIHTWVTEIE